ncbi:uncharacterized protein BX664DRAFT_382158 [Halteromyces radiatus]|uniref:uncharacterized protein n=1 Tax=Halteromyces radiatus TaxID=101107 RepID=UPI0022210588|nr:uncharacterized protein BX664DRAFT_382158 [Halteromyces radiatus]KAI8099646.1 hypothetical protein BX664DRAFT_382158 [Halteromyces radiatus]
MGYASLDAALAFVNNLPPTKSHLVITDTLKSDANFLIHHFVTNQLKGQRRVILIGLAQIFNHYFLISRKLGTNLLPYKQNGRLVFIDGVTHLNEYSLDTPYPPLKTPTTPTDTLNNQDLKTFYMIIKQYIQQQEQPLLILDDVSMLLSNGFGLAETCTFINKLKVLMESVDGTLISLIHTDEEGNDDIEQDAFVKSVIQSSEIILQVQPLGSGLAKDVHGQLSIIVGPKHLPRSINIQPQSMHYKILDNNVQFFAKGISQGVL